MSEGPPPPPPPHGENPKTTAGGGLPAGRYDIFVIPEHSAGAGFLYLPSLQPNINSFVAGFASALACVVLFQSMAPALQQWWSNFQGMGNMGMFLLMVAIGLGAWAFGRQQGDSTKPSAQNHRRHDSEGRRGPFTSSGTGTFGGGQGSYSSAPPPPPPPHDGPHPHQHAPPPQTGPPPNHYQPHDNPPPPPPPPPPEPEQPKSEPPKPAPPKADPPKHEPPKPEAKKEAPQNAWQKAREETRKREEERKAKEAEQKRREDAARRLRELREKEAREREQREKAKKEKEEQEKAAREREAKEKERIIQEARLREKLEKEAKEAKERLEKERKEREKEEEEAKGRKGSTYAYSRVGERMSMWPNGRPPESPPSTPNPAASRPAAPSSTTSTPKPASPATRKPPAPPRSTTGTSTTGTEQTERESEYSYRPYDQAKRPAHKKSVSDFSETSWAPSQSTARTTPPPSMREPYSTKDPDKILLKSVYCYLNQFAKTPASQLISGMGTVTDGLIFRIATAGLFIDDDVRGVAQREWDIKAWTLKLVEVWCPVHSITAAAQTTGSPAPASHAFFKGRRTAGPDRGTPKTLTGDEADTFLMDMLRTCKETCGQGLAPKPAGSRVSARNDIHQPGDWQKKGLHLLRTTLRDQEGKRYLFVVPEEDAWKVALGLQRLRRGTQVRALGVSAFTQAEAKNCLETLGW
ncbi:hypothetical protein DL546_003919 [Coniochaeta pulveracea]|uniref:Uncharacterized protein n=1 Tax=Coniochaeta pulveracea TaxID=177199 RepID=A0A420Y2Z9_9PEZI|nr:hypothetical protein DL546_003919 [Coniochaeta pulveracea]